MFDPATRNRSTEASVRARHLREELLARAASRGSVYSERVRLAFHSVPRHLFVDRYLDRASGEWVELDSRNLTDHLQELYRDVPLTIWTNDAFESLSTISQPTFVLSILDLLDIRPGDSVFELGTGSGWNAALLAHLTKPGRVYSAEIVRPLAESATRRLALLGVENVEVVSGSGTGVPSDARFDKGIFTAGAWDLPRAFYRAIRQGGRLVFVLRFPDETDLLILFRRSGDGFVSERLIECEFVPVTGAPEWERYGRRKLSDLLTEAGVAGVSPRPGRRSELTRACGAGEFRKFLSLHTEYASLRRKDGEFAWIDRDRRSLAVWRGAALEVYGESGEEGMSRALALWERWGRPCVTELHVTVRPVDLEAKGSVGEAIAMRRLESEFIWTSTVVPGDF